MLAEVINANRFSLVRTFRVVKKRFRYILFILHYVLDNILYEVR